MININKKYCKICGKEMKWNYTHDDGEWYTCDCDGVLEIDKLQKEIVALEKEILIKRNRIKEINHVSVYEKIIEMHNKNIEKYDVSQNDI